MTKLLRPHSLLKLNVPQDLDAVNPLEKMIPVTPELKKSIQTALDEEISKERKEVLHGLVEYIIKKRTENSVVNLNFVCTHNSRRSQFSHSIAWPIYRCQLSPILFLRF